MEKSQRTRNETSHNEPHNKIKRPWQCFIYQPFTQNYCCHSVWHELNTPAEKHKVVLNGNALMNFINYLWWVKRKILPEIVSQLNISYVMFAQLCTPPTHPQPNSCPCAANFKRVLVGWEEKLMQIRPVTEGLSCWPMPRRLSLKDC